jgi:putative DNA primase/helicase
MYQTQEAAPLLSTADKVLAELSRYGLRAKPGGRYLSNSPLRPGSNSHALSLVINGPEHGAYLDFVSGEQGSLYELAAKLNIETPRHHPTARMLVATYDYVDEAGQLLYQACRYEPGRDGRKKDFTQRVPDGRGGWIWSMEGVPRVLYRLPEVLAAVAAEETIYIVEGEKDADQLTLYELTATTNIAGAGKWRNEYTTALHGAHVVILPDNDQPGKSHGDTVAASLYETVASLKVVHLPELPPKGDVSDWLAAGHTLDELHTLVATTAAYVPTTGRVAPTSAQAQPNRTEDWSREEEHATDLGNARRLCRLFGERIRYVYSWGAWLIWDGTRWAKDDTGAIDRLARETVRTMYAEAADIDDSGTRKALGRWALVSESASKLSAMVDLARAELGIAVHHTNLDTNPWVLNCLNGTLDLRTGSLYPHNHADLLTKRISVTYDPAATAPTWTRFLERITNGDLALADYMQRIAGYTLTGRVEEQCLFFCHGSGSNGKSTFVETLATLLGDFWQKAPTEMIMLQRNGGSIPNDVARLPGARMVVTGELAQGRRLDESKVKDLTGGDTLVARFMREEFFEFRPVFKLWMYGNHKPNICGDDNGIWRRIRLIPFKATISDAEKDPALFEKLKAELPGILAWAVRGCLQWQHEGLGTPPAVQDATESYRSEMDIVGTFLDECCVLDSSARANTTTLYKSFDDWCKTTGEHVLTQRAFGQRLDARGLISKRVTQGIMRLGVGLVVHQDNEISG